MSQSVVLKSFAELETFFGPGDLVTDSDPIPLDVVNTEPCDECLELSVLLQDLETAGTALARTIVRDQQQRALAARDLERYDTLVGQQREAESARAQAVAIRQEAESFAELAFAEEAQSEAKRVIAIARKAEGVAAQHAQRWRAEAELLAAELNLERLLTVRRRQEEIAKEKAAAAERAGRLAEILARAVSALDAGHIEEARRLVATAGSDDPNHPEVTSLTEIIARRETSVKVERAEDAIGWSRRTYRQDPAGVVARLASLDVTGLPVDIARQIFGEWARACSRLCRERGLVEPLRYAPDPGRGVILARESAETAYVVVSSLGMGPPWQPGEVVDDWRVRRARPLR